MDQSQAPENLISTLMIFYGWAEQRSVPCRLDKENAL